MAYPCPCELETDLDLDSGLLISSDLCKWPPFSERVPRRLGRLEWDHPNIFSGWIWDSYFISSCLLNSCDIYFLFFSNGRSANNQRAKHRMWDEECKSDGEEWWGGQSWWLSASQGWVSAVNVSWLGGNWRTQSSNGGPMGLWVLVYQIFPSFKRMSKLIFACEMLFKVFKCWLKLVLNVCLIKK